jgi:putative transposase
VAWKKTDGEKGPLVSHTGVVLSRATTFRFELDPTDEVEQRLWMFAGARRFAFNHHIGRVKANLEVRQADKAAGLKRPEMTPSLPWSKQSFINEFNSWKNGTAPDSLVGEDGTRGFSWRGEIAADVFECASVDAAQALANYKESVSGARAGVKVGFPEFKSKHRDRPRFRLRSKSIPGDGTGPVRRLDPSPAAQAGRGEDQGLRPQGGPDDRLRPVACPLGHRLSPGGPVVCERQRGGRRVPPPAPIPQPPPNRRCRR